MVQNKLKAAKMAMEIHDNNFRNKLPVVGDGNCLPKTVSVACVGDETYHRDKDQNSG